MTNNPNRRPGDGPQNHNPALRPGTASAGDGPTATYAQVDHMSALMRQLSGLLEQSLQSLGKAKDSLSGEAVLEMATAGEVERQLHSAAEGLERMSELVHAAMQGPSVTIGCPVIARARPVTLGESAQHAVDVLEPFAVEKGVEVSLEIAPGIAAIPAGALYTVLLNGIQNAIEAVARRGGRGRIDISVRHDHPPAGVGYGRDSRDWYTLEISDNGVGLPAGDASRVFNLGYSTKPNGTGVGLAVARSVVQGMGGSVELLARSTEPRAGAVLRVKFPNPSSAPNLKLGGAA
jgi:signal transduction histidine kinase